MLCLESSPNATDILFFTADVFLESLYGNPCLEQDFSWNARGESPNKGLSVTFLRSVRSHPLLRHPQTFRNWICLKPAVPLLWQFWSMAPNVYFCLTSLAFTKYSDLFHNRRNWCTKRSYEHQNLNVTWIVQAQGNQVPPGYHRTFHF